MSFDSFLFIFFSICCSVSDSLNWTSQFLREQAALSAIEITADTVDNFVADLDNDDEEIPGPSEKRSIWKRLIMNVVDSPSTKSSDGSILQVQNKIGTPKINGKYNKNVEKMSLKMNGKVIPELVHSNFPTYKDVLPGLESWKDSRIASWHNIEGHSIQWFCVICIDKNGLFSSPLSLRPMISHIALFPNSFCIYCCRNASRSHICINRHWG